MIVLAAFCVMLVCSVALADEKVPTPVAPSKPVPPKAPSLTVPKAAAPTVKNEEYFHMVTVQLKNLREHAKMLYHQASGKMGEEINMEVAKEHVADMGTSLEATRKNFDTIVAGLSDKEETDIKSTIDDMNTSLARADDELKALKAEMEAPRPSKANIKKQAAGMHQEAQKMLTRHETLKQKYMITEPAPPLYPQPEE